MDIVTLGAALNGAKKQTENYVGSHFKGGSNIQITNNPDGTQTISASGEVSAEDTVARETISDHISDKANPHEVTAAQVGLGNVNNTSDIDKPVSTAMQTALDAKANTADIYSKNEVDTALSSKQNTIPDLADIRSGAALGSTAVQSVSGKGLSTNDFTDAEKAKLDNHVADTNNPHQVTKAQVGLGNVDNVATKDAIAELVDAGAKNLLKITATSQTNNGVTFTVNTDQTVTVNGTNTGTGSITFILVPNQQAILIPDGDYWFSGCPQGGGADAFDLRWFRYSPNASAYDIGSGVAVHKSGNTIDSNIAIVVKSGATVNNITFKPMLCTKAAWDISQKYVPYRPSYDELIARVEALEQAAGINSVRSMVNLTTETVVDTTETEGEELR